jgi:hypothetical protein
LGQLREFHGTFSASFFFAHGRHFSGKAMLNAGHAKSSHRPVGQTKVPAPKNYLHFALSQSKPWEPWLLAPMAAILFTCPNMGIPVQVWLAGDNRSDNTGETFEPIECIACRRFHYVNPATGRVLGARHK